MIVKVTPTEEAGRVLKMKKLMPRIIEPIWNVGEDWNCAVSNCFAPIFV